MHHEQLQLLTELEVDFYTSKKKIENRGAIFFHQNSGYISEYYI